MTENWSWGVELRIGGLSTPSKKEEKRGDGAECYLCCHHIWLKWQRELMLYYDGCEALRCPADESNNYFLLKHFMLQKDQMKGLSGCCRALILRIFQNIQRGKFSVSWRNQWGCLMSCVLFEELFICSTERDKHLCCLACCHQASQI